MKKLYSTIMLLAIIITASAQSDFDIAQSFMSKKGVTLKEYSKTSNRGSGIDKPYSIFKGVDNKGFAIVANSNVVGYSVENDIDEENLPEPLKIMLEGASSINAQRRGSSSEFPNWFTPRNVEPISPMITTRWSQKPPYNNLLPKKSSICYIVAHAQIIHYFKIPHTYCTIVDKEEKYFSEPLPIMSFDHSKMLDDYKGEYTQEEIEEIEKFFYCIFYSTITAVTDINITDNFNMVGEGYFSFLDKNWWDKIDDYLERGIPVYAGGANHAFIIDGRDDTGLFHANFGWGGISDGYYVFPNELLDSTNSDTTYRGYNYYAHLLNGVMAFYPIGWTSSVKWPTYDDRFKGDENVYNLGGINVGKHLENLPNGVYIKGGKKYIVK